MTSDETPATDDPRRGEAAEAREPATLKDAIADALRTVYEPEIPISIYELGLIYNIAVDEAGKVNIVMTLTAPACPVADILPEEVAEKARAVDGVAEVKVELVWDPPWTPDMMSEAARLELGMF